MSRRTSRIVVAGAVAVFLGAGSGCAGPADPPAGEPAEARSTGGAGGAEPMGAPAAGAAPSPTRLPAAADPASGSAPTPAYPLAATLDRLHQGIDVSWHSGAIDWARVAAEGHGFAVIKASEGVDNPDRAFTEHWHGAKEAGLVRGAYHFYVTEDDPHEQARLFIATVELGPGDLAPVVDVELIGHDTPPGLADRLRTFLEIVEAHFGITPIIYTGPNFWDANLTADFGRYPLWVAEYGVAEPRLPAGWETWHLWQWKGDAEVPGVEKDADLSRTNRTRVDLAALVVRE